MAAYFFGSIKQKRPGISRKQFYILVGLGSSFEVGLLTLILVGNLTRTAGFYIGVVAVLFLLFALAVRQVVYKKNDLSSPGLLIVILFFAALFRLTLVWVAPTLSTDQFRYTWEGRLVTLGISPYRYAPNDPALASYRSEIWPLVQQKETASPYPPLAQLIGAGEYLLFGESLLGPKIVAVIFDLLNCLALLWLLKLYGLASSRLILYAWCPLPVLEFGISGHNDAPMLFLLLLAIGLATQRKTTSSALLLGLATLAKFTALFGLPLFLVNWWQAKSGPDGSEKSGWNWKKILLPRLWRDSFLTAGIIVTGYIPFLVIGKGAIGSLFEYTGTWRDNDSLIFQLTADSIGLTIAKIGSLLALGLGWCLLSFHPRLSVELSLPRRLMLLFGLTLLVASTVHPWYVSWLLVLLPLVYGQGFKGWDNGWLLFAALVQLTYLTYSGDLTLYNWIRPLEYWPLYLLIGWNWFNWWHNRTALQIAQLQIREGNITDDSAA